MKKYGIFQKRRKNGNLKINGLMSSFLDELLVANFSVSVHQQIWGKNLRFFLPCGNYFKLRNVLVLFCDMKLRVLCTILQIKGGSASI